MTTPACPRCSSAACDNDDPPWVVGSCCKPAPPDAGGTGEPALRKAPALTPIYDDVFERGAAQIDALADAPEKPRLDDDLEADGRFVAGLTGSPRAIAAAANLLLRLAELQRRRDADKAREAERPSRDELLAGLGRIARIESDDRPNEADHEALAEAVATARRLCPGWEVLP